MVDTQNLLLALELRESQTSVMYIGINFKIIMIHVSKAEGRVESLFSNLLVLIIEQMDENIDSAELIQSSYILMCHSTLPYSSRSSC